MLKVLWFISLAVVIAALSYYLTTLSQTLSLATEYPLLGTSAASVLLSVAILGSD